VGFFFLVLVWFNRGSRGFFTSKFSIRSFLLLLLLLLLQIAMLAAIGKLSRICTAQQMALELHRADEVAIVQHELDRLLVDTGGSYELSKEEDGVIVYTFPLDYRARALRKKTAWAIREKVIPVLLRGVKLFIGVFLVFSLCLVLLILLLISLRNQGSRTHHRTNFANSYNTFVLWSFWRRNPFFRNNEYDYRPVQPSSSSTSSSSSLADEIFAFIFGPPRNVDEEERWSQIKSAIRRSNYVVSADQLRPFTLDPFEPGNGFMGEICSGLGGFPETDLEDNIIYKFEAFRKNEMSKNPPLSSARYYREPQWLFTDRSITLALILGFANIVALLALYPYIRAMDGAAFGGNLRGSRARISFSIENMKERSPLIYLLLRVAYSMRHLLFAYAMLYFLIPGLRFLLLVKFQNQRIAARNEKRANLVQDRLHS